MEDRHLSLVVCYVCVWKRKRIPLVIHTFNPMLQSKFVIRKYNRNALVFQKYVCDKSGGGITSNP